MIERGGQPEGVLKSSGYLAVALFIGGCAGSISDRRADVGPTYATIYAIAERASDNETCSASTIPYYRLWPHGRTRRVAESHVYFADPGEYVFAVRCPGTYEHDECLTWWYDFGMPEARLALQSGGEYVATCTSDGKPLIKPLAELGTNERLAEPVARKARTPVVPDPGPLRPFPEDLLQF